MTNRPGVESSSSRGAIVAAVSAGLVLGAGVATLGAIAIARKRNERERGLGSRHQDGGNALPESPTGGVPSPTLPGRARLPEGSWHESDLRPPLPADVVRLLESSRLCFLSTFCDDHPHLSLMNFTYCASDEVIILSTRRDTKKFEFVQKARNVAILVHEFPGGVPRQDTIGTGSCAPSPKGRSGKLTITLNGSASIKEGALAEKYRALHAENNPDSKTFIVGVNIAIITVRVRSARICNVRDEVTFWDVASSMTTG